MTFSYSRLKGRIKERFDTQSKFAENLGLSRTSLNLKLNNAVEFSQGEILRAVNLLQIAPEDVCEYFFTPEVKKT